MSSGFLETSTGLRCWGAMATPTYLHLILTIYLPWASTRGQKWTDSSIRGILANEKYIGDMLHQKTYTDDNFKRYKNNREKAQYYIKDHLHP